jgi:2-keto-3-deoxy-6-phosphogluconate aldolase
VGGSWIVPSKLIKEKRFDEITELTREALERIV